MPGCVELNGLRHALTRTVARPLIDRRDFLKCGIFAVGAAFGCSLMSCDSAVPFDPGPPAPARGAHVSLSNFTVNGNQGNGHGGNSTSGDRRGITGKVWYCGINLMNLNNIYIEKVVVVKTPAYHIRFSNVGNVKVSGCVLKSYGLNTDGLHFDGPANDITISNCDFTTGDDSIGLNCPEGYSGDISQVTVKDCTFNSVSLMRLYTTNWNTSKFHIDSVSVRNCSGKLTETAFLIGISGNSDSNSIDHLSISDCNLTAPTVLGMAENFGNITLKNVTLNPSTSIGFEVREFVSIDRIANAMINHRSR